MRRMARPEQRLEWLTAVWPVVMGARLAAHTRPLNWKDGVLEIGVAGEGWQEQLNEMTGTLRRQINLWWGGEVVEQVRLTQDGSATPGRAGKKPPVRFELDEEHLPFIRRRSRKK
jgi:hypothetical protein